MNISERNAAAANLIRDAAKTVPPGLAWALHEAADHCETSGPDDVVRGVVGKVLAIWQGRDKSQLSLMSDLASVNALLSCVPRR